MMGDYDKTTKEQKKADCTRDERPDLVMVGGCGKSFTLPSLSLRAMHM